MFADFKKMFGAILVLVAVACVFGLTASAQQTEKAGKKGGNVSVTGCLQKGDEADEFMLTGDDGKTYGLRSSSVKLGDHVGHKITVTGNLKAESAEKGEKDEDEAKEKKEGGNKEAGDIQVSKLKMVSESCSK